MCSYQGAMYWRTKLYTEGVEACSESLALTNEMGWWAVWTFTLLRFTLSVPIMLMDQAQKLAHECVSCILYSS